MPVYVSCLLAATRPEHLGHKLIRQRDLDFLRDCLTNRMVLRIDFSACLTKRDGLPVGCFYSTIYEKFAFKNATNVGLTYLVSRLCPDSLEKLTIRTESAFLKKSENVVQTLCA